MKLGTSIILLVLILIAFGYVLSDDHHIRNDLDTALAQVDGLNDQVGVVNEELSACQKSVQESQQLISQQSSEMALLKNEISARDQEINNLQVSGSQQSARITELQDKLVVLAAKENNAKDVQSANTSWMADPLVLMIAIAQAVIFFVQKKQKNGYIRLTSEERALIIKMRRRNK
jgi:hypothetical protein